MTRQLVDHNTLARCRSRLCPAASTRDDLRDAAARLLEAGSVPEAWEPLCKLAALKPHDVSLQLLCGVVAAELGKLDEAETAFREAMRQEPTAIAAYHNLAVLYLSTNRPEPAEEQFQAILRIEPENAEALNDLAVLYASSGREEEACRFFARCVAVAPDYRKGWQNALEFANDTAQYARGAEWVRRLIDRHSADAQLQEWQETFARAMRHDTPSVDSAPEAGRQIVPDLGRVSIIIPVHNAEGLIASTLESVLSEAGLDLEIIVVDDGSADDTDQVIQRFSEQVRYVRRVRQGWAAAVNEGIQRARGAWILVLTPGDILTPGGLGQILVQVAGDVAIDVLEVRDAGSDQDMPRSWLFRRTALARVGFFNELDSDEDGLWSRRLMNEKIKQFGRVRQIDSSRLFSATPVPGNLRQVATGAADRDRVMQRWVDETQSTHPDNCAGDAPALRTTRRTGLLFVIVGFDDPGGMLSSLALAVNEFTPHRCRVIVPTTSGAYDSRVLLKLPVDAAGRDAFGQQVRALAQHADRLVFAAGLASGAARRDRRLDDADELGWEVFGLREQAEKKACAAILCSSPSVRGNYTWYGERFARRGWPILTAWPDIYLNVSESHFIPAVIDPFRPEYTRTDFSVGPVAIVHHDRPTYAMGGEDLLGSVAAPVKAKYGDAVLFGRCAEMTLHEALEFRRCAHIGFDRISLGAPRFGLTSLENSALGLVNIVYLDPFARAVLARTLGTDELPWVSADSAESLFVALDRLVADPPALRQRMAATAQWFRRWWSPDRVVHWFTDVLENS